jgi:hypothetical protein
MKKVAICIKGAVGKKGTAHERFYHTNEVYRPGEYIDYIAVRNSIIKHIVDANPGYEFDFFLHGWNIELEDELIDLYRPKKHLFEDNNIYNDEISSMIKDPSDFGGVSGSLSLKKSLELKEQYEKDVDIKYDIIIVYRYDVLIWKDMILELYDVKNSMFVNSWNGSCLADYHFVMSNEMSIEFKYLYDSIINYNNQHLFHHWIYNYIVNIMKCNLREDSIIVGSHQEHMRLIIPNSNLFHVLSNYK